MGGMRALIGYLVAVALGMGLGACAEASRPPPNEATGVEDGGDDGAAGATAASPDAATRSTEAGPDAATRSTDAGTFVPTMTTDAGPGLEPTRVFRGDPTVEFWDLTLRGEELDHLDGRIVTVRVGIPASASERLGSGQARIDGGRFELFLASVWEANIYKAKARSLQRSAMLLDRGRDDRLGPCRGLRQVRGGRRDDSAAFHVQHELRARRTARVRIAVAAVVEHA
jgi:hypothetical protein